jgi:CRP/FNR family transcriptional regulator, cyclic AMP receptor protein
VTVTSPFDGLIAASQRSLASALVRGQNCTIEQRGRVPIGTIRSAEVGPPATVASGRVLAMAVSSSELKAFLLDTPFFGGLSDASLDLLVPMLVERRFDVGATVVAEGEPGRSMFIVQSGELVVSSLGNSGHTIRMACLGSGDFFGEMTLIEMQNRSATVVTESPTVLYELTARQLYTYYKTDMQAYVLVLQNINRELCRRLRRADKRIADLQILRE